MKNSAGSFENSSSSTDSLKKEYEAGMQEDEVLYLIEELREKWIREDELTYATQVDFDVAQMQIAALEDATKSQGSQIIENSKLESDQRAVLDKRIDDVLKLSQENKTRIDELFDLASTHKLDSEANDALI